MNLDSCSRNLKNLLIAKLSSKTVMVLFLLHTGFPGMSGCGPVTSWEHQRFLTKAASARELVLSP